MRLFSLYETLVRFVAPWCTSSPFRPYSGTPITQGNNIVDISGMGLKQFWDLKSHLQDSSQLATAHYPETLDNIFVSEDVRKPRELSLRRVLPTSGDRCPFILPDHMVLAQEMVRSHCRLQDTRPRSFRRPAGTLHVYRRGKYPKEIWRRAGI